MRGCDNAGMWATSSRTSEASRGIRTSSFSWLLDDGTRIVNGDHAGRAGSLHRLCSDPHQQIDAEHAEARARTRRTAFGVVAGRWKERSAGPSEHSWDCG